MLTLCANVANNYFDYLIIIYIVIPVVNCRIVSVGGDGMFSEVVDGLLSKVVKESGVDDPTPDSNLPQPKLRLGIIPAGK